MSVVIEDCDDDTSAEVAAACSEASTDAKREAYYLTNFKSILESCMLPSNPERHVFNSLDQEVVARFHQLDGEKLGLGSLYMTERYLCWCNSEECGHESAGTGMLRGQFLSLRHGRVYVSIATVCADSFGKPYSMMT